MLAAQDLDHAFARGSTRCGRTGRRFPATLAGVNRQCRGSLRAGDLVQLTDPKGRKHLVTLADGGSFHTHRGSLAHDELIGEPDGSVVNSSGGTPYVALRPLLADFTLGMGRGAAVIYPKDAAHIVAFGEIFPGAGVLEAGAGRRAVVLAAARGRGRRAGRVPRAQARLRRGGPQNVEKFFGGRHRPCGRPWRPGRRRAADDRFDWVGVMPAPWEFAAAAGRLPIPGGWPAVTSRPPRSCPGPPKRSGTGLFDEPAAWESLVRGSHADGLAVGPDTGWSGTPGSSSPREGRPTA